MPVTNETEVMREMWRIAYSRPNGVTIPCPDRASAIRLRFALYNAVKQFRSGRAEADNALANAIANCSLTLGDDQRSIVMGRKLDSATSKAMLALLGGQLPQAVEDAAAHEAMQRILGQVNETLATPAEPSAAATIAATNASRYGARK